MIKFLRWCGSRVVMVYEVGHPRVVGFMIVGVL